MRQGASCHDADCLRSGSSSALHRWSRGRAGTGADSLAGRAEKEPANRLRTYAVDFNGPGQARKSGQFECPVLVGHAERLLITATLWTVARLLRTASLKRVSENVRG